MIRRRPITADANVVPFRHRGRAVRHRRRHPLIRWLKPLAWALVIVGVPAVAIGWLLTSDRFALREVVIVTGERVPEVWVRQTVRPFVGRHLLWIDLERVDRRLRRHLWIESLGLRKDLPGRLTVRVVERRAVALLRHQMRLFYLDAEGEVIAPFEPRTGPADLMLVSRRPGAATAHPRAALAFAGELTALEPRWVEGLSEIEILGEEDFRIFSSSLPFPLLMRKGTLESKTRRLAMLLPQITARYPAVAAVDIRFSRRIIVQPSVDGDPRHVAGTRRGLSAATSG